MRENNKYSKIIYKTPLTFTAGSANAKNPISIIVPCYRVIRLNGQVGDYTGGISIKQTGADA
ncbi:MGMT family protein [Fastidiosibacter lacustris]|uniref:MGMT family protein n=1 Tax=Fastidiosibacter lacustris TaxID=2056695 RepID=UPI001EFE6288|nr:MGMT family protein [Fastidiosibacter lacustris]